MTSSSGARVITASTIDLENVHGESVALIDLENIRLSWQKEYRRVFEYDDLVLLCDLAERLVRAPISRVIVFATDPEEYRAQQVKFEAVRARLLAPTLARPLSEHEANTLATELARRGVTLRPDVAAGLRIVQRLQEDALGDAFVPPASIAAQGPPPKKARVEAVSSPVVQPPPKILPSPALAHSVGGHTAGAIEEPRSIHPAPRIIRVGQFPQQSTARTTATDSIIQVLSEVSDTSSSSESGSESLDGVGESVCSSDSEPDAEAEEDSAGSKGSMSELSSPVSSRRQSLENSIPGSRQSVVSDYGAHSPVSNGLSSASRAADIPGPPKSVYSTPAAESIEPDIQPRSEPPRSDQADEVPGRGQATSLGAAKHAAESGAFSLSSSESEVQPAEEGSSSSSASSPSSGSSSSSSSETGSSSESNDDDCIMVLGEGSAAAAGSAPQKNRLRKRTQSEDDVELIKIAHVESAKTHGATRATRRKNGQRKLSPTETIEVADEGAPMARRLTGINHVRAVELRLYGFKNQKGRLVQRGCDVALGAEITKACFHPYIEHILLFSADSDFYELMEQNLTAENIGGIYKFVKTSWICGFQASFKRSDLRLQIHQDTSRRLVQREQPGSISTTGHRGVYRKGRLNYVVIDQVWPEIKQQFESNRVQRIPWSPY